MQAVAMARLFESGTFETKNYKSKVSRLCGIRFLLRQRVGVLVPRNNLRANHSVNLHYDRRV